ncbi:alpha/beta hydrolase [Candidatus Sumerlaeota bacterium]|nr:alpha/beta hydrolase [Candidatus Sumerlaeota bacterium]
MKTFLKKKGMLSAAVAVAILVSPAVAARQTAPAKETETDEAVATSTVAVTRNIVYARVGEHDLLLDLYEPTKGGGPFPGVICIHGGGMSGGNKTAFGRHAAYLAERGYVAVSVDYRLSGVAKYPASINDCKAAVRWMRANAKKYRIAPDRIGAIGGSAGGYLVAMLAATTDKPEFDGEVGVTGFSSRVQAAVPLAPPADLLLRARMMPGAGTTKSYTAYLGAGPDENPRRWEQASPINHVDRKSAPMLIMHATGDPTTPYQVSVELQKRCEAVGAQSELVPIEYNSHSFWSAKNWFGPTMERATAFFDRQIGDSHLFSP